MGALSCSATASIPTCWPPSIVSRPGPEKLTTGQLTDPKVGVAWTSMMCASPKPGPRTNEERPAIRHSKLPDAEPESAMVTFIATCEMEAVPPPERWLVASDALAVAEPKVNAAAITVAAASAVKSLLVDLLPYMLAPSTGMAEGGRREPPPSRLDRYPTTWNAVRLPNGAMPSGATRFQ